MSVLLFDLETNGLMPEVSKIHCIAISIDGSDPTLFDTPDQITHAIQLIQDHEGIIAGHNILSYDLPVLRKLYPNFLAKGTVRDTKLLSTLIWPDLKERDFKLAARDQSFPKECIGQHRLKAWGHRLWLLKGDFGETTDWKEYTLQMGEYCKQDVRVTAKLWELIASKHFSERSIQLEHEFQRDILHMESSGFPFDKPKAIELYARLSKRRLELEAELKTAFPPWEIRTPFTPKVNNKARGYVKGVLMEKVTTVEFNPASRDHIALCLTRKYSWKPQAFTDGGKPQVDEEVLSKLVYPEAKLLSEYLMVEKRIGQIGDGQNGWLKLERNGRIYGRINTNIISGRCSHVSPNMAQVPSCDKPYGEECRALFTPPPGSLLVGVDASGIQLRALSHYLTLYDGGTYRDVVLNGDIHTHNQKAAGLDTRAKAKTFIYAFLMGAGPGKLAEIAGIGPRMGKALMEKFLRAIPALAQFRLDIEKRAKQRGYVVGLDGRHIPVRDMHACLSHLMQCFEACVMKRATSLLFQRLTPEQFKLHAFVHDEWQMSAPPDQAELVGKTAVQSIVDAGIEFNSRCPLQGEWRVGNNWKETH